MYDDILNYTATGWAIENGMTLWEMTKHFAMHWFVNEGRAFFFAWYAYLFFSVVGLHAYKFLIVVTTFIGGALLGKIVELLNGNKYLSIILMVLFPVIVSLDCSYFNAMYGFHLLLQITLIWNLLGVVFFLLYRRDGKNFTKS